MHRLVTLLTEEIRWGRLALMALAAALLAQLAIPVASGILSFMPLLAFTVAGILVEQAAPRRPFWNSLVLGILGVVFSLGFFVLRSLGIAQALPTHSEVIFVLITPMSSFIPQALIGTWIATTIRRAREVAQEGGKGGREREPGLRKEEGAKQHRSPRKTRKRG